MNKYWDEKALDFIFERILLFLYTLFENNPYKIIRVIALLTAFVFLVPLIIICLMPIMFLLGVDVFRDC